MLDKHLGQKIMPLNICQEILTNFRNLHNFFTTGFNSKFSTKHLTNHTSNMALPPFVMWNTSTSIRSVHANWDKWQRMYGWMHIQWYN